MRRGVWKWDGWDKKSTIYYGLEKVTYKIQEVVTFLEVQHFYYWIDGNFVAGQFYWLVKIKKIFLTVPKEYLGRHMHRPLFWSSHSSCSQCWAHWVMQVHVHEVTWHSHVIFRKFPHDLSKAKAEITSWIERDWLSVKPMTWHRNLYSPTSSQNACHVFPRMHVA